MISIILGYILWYLFIFIGVAWMLILMISGSDINVRRKLKRYPSVSIIIPAHNEQATIEKTIKSAQGLNYPKNLIQIIVVDDGSTDGTAQVVSKFSDNVKIIRNVRNIGKAASLNRGYKAATGEFIACLDADSVVEKDILQKMLPYFDNEKVAAVSPALEVWKKTNFLEKAQYAEYVFNILLRKLLAVIDSVFVTPGAFSIYRKKTITEVGGFDESNATEDMEIAFRLQDRGYIIEADLQAKSYTMCPQTLGDLLRQRLRWYRGSVHNMLKYRHMFFSKSFGYLGNVIMPINFATAILIVLIFASMAWEHLYSFANFIWNLYLINFDVGLLLTSFNLAEYLARVMPYMVTTPLILGVMAIFLTSYLLYISFNSGNYNMKSNKAGYIGYMVLLPTLFMAVWAMAFVSEIIGMKKKW